MDFLELAAKRYSVRKFREEKVRQEDLDKILKPACSPPRRITTSRSAFWS